MTAPSATARRTIHRQGLVWLNRCRRCACLLLGMSFTVANCALQAEPDAGYPSMKALEETIVTARKRPEESQSIPMAVSIYVSSQIERLKLHGLGDLAVGMSNVALDDIGTTRGTANFSIRGLGINSSIPSIAPTVGVIVDGVYMGTNAGVLFDTFDLNSIEVLRGPQGSLYGRNVTGGAILLNSRAPTEQFELRARGTLEGGERGGLNQYLTTSISGPLGSRVLGRLTTYQNDDEGALVNGYDGENFGALRQTVVRPVIALQFNDDTELLLRYQYADLDGDAPAGQSHTNGSGIDGSPINNDRDSFDFAIDETGYQRDRTHFVSTELNRDIVLGKGTITHIAGWREHSSESRGDVDSQPLNLFHALGWMESQQFSNELRYTGTPARGLRLTAGLYYFRDRVEMHEQRNFLGIATADGSPALRMDGGGRYRVETKALFASMDYDFNTRWVFSLGGRWTLERKRARVASLNRNINSPCNIVTANDCGFDFNSERSWNSFSPKLGLMYHLDSNSRLYTHWARGFRSGGYNLRNTAVDIVNLGPGPFDQEQVDSFELGYKSEWGRGRFNAALFLNRVSDMQRELNLADPVAGIVQVIKNTADADIPGLEVEILYALNAQFSLSASIGYIDPQYTDLRFDLNGDGHIDARDKSLDIPRAAGMTGSLSLNYQRSLSDIGHLHSRISYAHRDESAYTDDNLGMIPQQNILDLDVDLKSPGGQWEFSLYARNLLDEVKYGGDNQLPATLGGVPLGGTFAPLSQGRTYGIAITYTFGP